MKRFTPQELEKFRALDKPIQDEVHYEKAIRAARKLRGRIRLDDDQPEEEMPAEVVALREALFDRVSEYEKKEYPYGQPNFEEWSNSLTDQQVEEKVARIEQAEKLVDELEEFEQRRTDRIKARLKEKELKQQDLAVILRKDKSYVSYLLSGRYPFTLEVVARLHDGLGVPYEDLVPPSEAFETAKIEQTTVRGRKEHVVVLDHHVTDDQKRSNQQGRYARGKNSPHVTDQEGRYARKGTTGRKKK